MKKTANVSVVQLTGDREVCLSYGVPVAAFVPGYGYIKTDRKYSSTSSKHANQYCGGGFNVSANVQMMDDAAFRALVPELVGKDGR